MEELISTLADALTIVLAVFAIREYCRKNDDL